MKGWNQLHPPRLLDYRAGDLLARIIDDVNTLEDFYVRVVTPPATAILICVGAALFLALNDPRLAVVLIGSFALLGIFLPIAVQRMSSTIGPEAVTQRSNLHAQLVDGVQGLAELLSFGRGPERIARLRAESEDYGDTQRRMAEIRGAQAAVHAFITNLSLWLIVWIVSPEISAGRIPGVMLAPLILLTASSFEAVAPLAQAAQAWSSIRAAAGRLFELVDAQPLVAEGIASRADSAPRRESAPSIEFSHVSFRYPGQAVLALKDVSFRLEPGQRLAVVGPSGAGKSTLTSLLLRFWEFHGGTICVGGRSIREYASDELRESVALISPNTYLFNTSVFENLRMARRRVTRLDVERAAQAAQIHELIVKLPKGYDTLIGEQGIRLSGGERQRLAIARAILKEAPILILDEPTANLDAVTEALILTSLFELTHSKATLLITHRLVGLDKVDEILFLEHGQIVERGTQADLLARDGAYLRFWGLQNRFLPEP